MNSSKGAAKNKLHGALLRRETRRLGEVRPQETATACFASNTTSFESRPARPTLPFTAPVQARRRVTTAPTVIARLERPVRRRP